MTDTLKLTIELMKRQSISPDDAGCQDILIERLQKIGFTIERMNFGKTANLWATHGEAAPILAFVGHTDVVPTGPVEAWSTPPFEPTVKNGTLYGRGAADMKSGVAAFVTAVERFLTKNKSHQGTIGLLLTSDEEADGLDGTVKVVEHLSARGTKIDYCLVGEPSAVSTVGDTIKNGRRGSLTCNLKVRGQQGHVAYPQKADNPVHKTMQALADLAATTWDEGNQFFPPTSFQISNIHAGTGADNVIPGLLDVVFNFRFSTEQTPEKLKERVHEVLASYSLTYETNWRLSGMPFLTSKGALLDAVIDSVRDVTGLETRPSTEGGTSDGRFLAPTGAQVVEVGVTNATIHKVDEQVAIAELETLSSIFERVLEKLFLA